MLLHSKKQIEIHSNIYKEVVEDLSFFHLLMITYLKKQCPEWANDTYLEHDLILGDDSDSGISCNLLDEITSGFWKANYFYNFNNFYRIEKTGLPIVGVDMAFMKKVKTFDNHVSKRYSHSNYNPLSMNLNLYKGISAEKNYHRKYPFSTLMLIMSYYDIPLPKSEIGKEIILAIDSAHKGHYASSDYYKGIHTNWLEELGFTSLIDVLNKRNRNYFKGVQGEYGLNEKIFIGDAGYLKSNINLEAIQPHLNWKLSIPEQPFKLLRKWNGDQHEIGEKKLPDSKKLISLAYTGKDYVCYTYQE
ncbi:hypothetical protein [Peribacillus asahii]|uniref:hypothetical protein n=1 Tax=Peribacillus asahii TaxID=228899 RepID=UPI002079F65E|nr:hypothetical protein [Peribacillus asahii]USK69194.1 hypothetical protein LIS76_16720 [Peribacillus asahii]